MYKTKFKVFSTFVAFFLIIQSAHAQVNLSFGAEIGLNSSGLPYFDKYEIENRKDLVKIKSIPILSPKVGVWTEIKLGKHLYTKVGVQHFKIGYKYHYHRDGNDLLYGGTYTSDIWETLSIDRVSFPISLGYDFTIKTRRLRAGIGYKFNYHIKGIYREQNLYIKENELPAIDRDETFNIFDKNQFSIVADKSNRGLLLEFGINLKEKLNLECSYAVNGIITFGNPFEPFYYYENSDFSIVLKYSIR